MRIIIPVLYTMLVISPLFALHDYRCSDNNLCEFNHEKNVESLKNAFSQGRVEGQVRLGSISQNNDASVDTLGTSLGGQLKYETAKLYNTTVAISTFISQKVTPLSGDPQRGELNGDFFGANGRSMVYLGEAYVEYEQNHFDLRIGRQKIDTPFNERDDIRMLPNTFEAAMAGYGGIENFIFVGGYITRWAGYDSGSDIGVYKNILEDSSAGVGLFGVMNESFENLELQAWIYNLGGSARIGYTDAMYADEYENGLSIESALQFGFYNELQDSGVDGGVYGAMMNLSYADLNVAAAFNVVDAGGGKSITLGYGGGPYFTSMEEMTIGDINDVQAYVLGFGYNFLETLCLSYAYGHFKGNELGIALEVDEHDMVLSYARDDWDFELSYAMLGDKLRDGALSVGYNRLLLRANYNFKTDQ